MSDRVAQQRVLTAIDPVALVDLASALIRMLQDRGDADGAVPRPGPHGQPMHESCWADTHLEHDMTPGQCLRVLVRAATRRRVSAR